MVDKRLKNYVNAIHYIKQNLISKPNFSDIKNNLLKNAELAHKIKKELQDGDDTNVFRIPPDVSPFDLFGISENDRLKKLQALISKITKLNNALIKAGSAYSKGQQDYQKKNSLLAQKLVKELMVMKKQVV